MGRSKRLPPCDHLHCRWLMFGKCVDADPVHTTGSQLRVMRDRAGLTQDEAGRLVGKGGATVNSAGRVWRRWEDGDEKPEGLVHLFALLTGQVYPCR